MTKVKQTQATIVEGKKTTIETTQYYEVGSCEVDAMLKKVAQGGNEEELREELIKKSKW